MAFAICSSLIVVVVVSFIVTAKRLHVYEYAFSFLWIVFLLITCVDMATPNNAHYIELTKDTTDYWAFRLVEILLVPSIILLYLDRMDAVRSVAGKASVTLLFITLLFGVESGAVLLHLLSYRDWHPWWSFPAWLAVLLVAYGSDRWYRKFLHREGVAA